LRTILLHNLSSFRRYYRARAKRQVAREVPLNTAAVGGRAQRDLVWPGPIPSAEVIRHEQATRLEAAISTLPAPYRRVVIMHSRNRLTFEAIGGELGCSAEAARKIHTRAMRQLTKLLG
jgi:RNA polymerase sigma factor (sigma-70 family)